MRAGLANIRDELDRQVKAFTGEGKLDVYKRQEEASAFFMPKFFARTQEAFYMAAVDDRRVLLRCVLISEGT